MKKKDVCILDDRSILYINGEDAREFLQNLISNDINKVSDKNSCFTSLLSPQGKFLYEFIIVNIGSAAYKGFGSSLKKTTTTVQTTGTIYKIYGCGYIMPRGTNVTQTLDEFMDVDPDILVPIEGTAVYAN